VFTLTTAAARRKFSELVNRVRFTKERAALTRYGQPVVALVPIEDLERLQGNSGKGPRSRTSKPAKTPDPPSGGRPARAVRARKR
jgi:prevent-host-death family protein